MPSEVEQAWRAIYRSYTRLGPAIDKRLRSAVGLSYSEYDTLSQLQSATQAMTMADLATRVAVTRTHASRLIDSLETAGLAIRETNPDDGRSVLVSITHDGVNCLRETGSTLETILSETVGVDLAGDEFRALVQILDLAVDRDE